MAESTTPAAEPPTPTPSATASEAATPTIEPTDPDSEAQVAEETVVRFASSDAFVDVTMAPESPAVTDFLSLLPLTLTFEEYGGREKISYLPRDLQTTGSPGSAPVTGDFSYYAPWGNVIFYYNADGLEYSDQTIHLGTYSATTEQLTLLESESLSVEILQ